MWKKITSAWLSVFFLVATNFCLVECAFAVSEHHHSEITAESSSQDHGSSGESHHESDSEKHDAGSLCCSDLVADQISSANSFDVQFLKNRVLGSFTAADLLFVLFLLEHSQYRVEFPPGSSPPTASLSAYFTHAPPAIL